MKSRFVLYVVGALLILGGLIIADYLDYRQKGEIIVAPPEGYEEFNVGISPDRGSKVGNLENEDPVITSYEDMLSMLPTRRQ